MSTSTLQERVKRLLNASGRDAKNFGVLCGLSTSHVGQITHGKIETLADKTLRKLAAATGADLGWIAWGAGKAPAAATVLASLARAAAKRAAAERSAAKRVAARAA